jgi:hydrogenase maturation protein HypF
LGQPGQWRRVASLRPFRLPGGDQASRDPWRCALALAWEVGRDWPGGPADPADHGLLRAAWERQINCPVTTSVGRLFDAAAALLGLAQSQSHEGQAAMALEACSAVSGEGLELPLDADAGLWRADWEPLLPMLMDTTRPAAERASRFHASLAHLLLRQAEQIRQDWGMRQVGLTGGVFQNRCLTEHAMQLLTSAGFTILFPGRLPVNDAAISLGQLIEAAVLDELDGDGASTAEFA